MAGKKETQRDLIPGDLVSFKRPHLDYGKDLYIIVEVHTTPVFRRMCKAAPIATPNSTNLFYPMEDFELV